jgi:phosphoribosylamine--glycine ligase
MKVAVIGNGGREHTLIWKLAQSPSVEKLYAIPGSAAIAELAECVPFDSQDLTGIANYAVKEKIDLIVVGPEAPLTQGITDICTQKGLVVFGPSQEAAQLEGSKIFAKNVMERYHIPTAKYKSFQVGDAAKAYIKEQGAPIVVKADGLAAGKGVVVAQTEKEACDAVDAMMMNKVFGEAGGRIVVEECMVGEEVSLLAFVDGKIIVPMIAAQDHKRIFDNDEGPNTGGMGAYAPAPVLTPALREETIKTILEPLVAGLANEGITYKGCLYAGLMITEEGPRVVEFNARFGDPETQAVLPLLEGDLAKIMYATATGTLEAKMVAWREGAAACVVMASAGYPKGSHKNDVIYGLDTVPDDVWVFHSGSDRQKDRYVTNGGRVLGVTAMGDDLLSAIKKAYEGVKRISFSGMQYRRDIGKKGLHTRK